MKDWKAECESLKGQLLQVKNDRDYYKQIYETKARRDSDLADRFKELLVEVLGRRD